MAENFNTQIIPVISNLLIKLKVPFTKFGLSKSIMSHPYYPSLLSISDTLNLYGIQNRALKVAPIQLEKLPKPFLAFVTIDEINTEDFVTVLDVSNEKITFFHKQKKTLDRSEFIEKWHDGIVMLVESTDNSIERELISNLKVEKNNNRKKTFQLIGLILCLIVGLYSFTYSVDQFLFPTFYLLVSFLGLAISVLLLVYEVDNSNSFVKNICTTGVKTNCDAVLNSSASKFLGFSWAEIGFYFFSGISLFLMTPLSFKLKIPYLTLLSTFTALYIPFSISYQYFVIKQWCKLCLAVQFCLILQFSIVTFYGNYDFKFSNDILFVFIICMLIPILIWNYTKPYIIKSKDLQHFEYEYKRIISRQDIFEQSIYDQNDLISGWEELGVIFKGNENARNVILKVCSPSCKYCSKAHETFNKLLNIKNDIKVVTIYGLTDDPFDQRRIPVRYFLALAELGEKEKLDEAMDYWYLTENPSIMFLESIFPVENEIIMKQESIINKMVEWSENAKIYYTPTVYWNGKKLPADYELEDLLNLYLTH